MLAFRGRLLACRLEGVTADASLRGYLSYLWGDYGLRPARASWVAHAMVANHYFDGASYPVGGPAVLGRRALATLRAHGGAAFVRARVAQILVDSAGGPTAAAKVAGTARCVGVRLVSGRELRAKCVVSAVGASNTLERLVPAEATPALDAPCAALGAALEPSAAHLSLFVALRGDAHDLQLPRTNYWIAPAHQGGPDAAAGGAELAVLAGGSAV